MIYKTYVSDDILVYYISMYQSPIIIRQSKIDVYITVI